jgi:transcriptional regulator with XRE-family HTH domain
VSLRHTQLAKKARESSGLSQRCLANRLGYGSPQMVSNWERGLCGVPKEAARDLCKVLDISWKTWVDTVMHDKRTEYVSGERAA